MGAFIRAWHYLGCVTDTNPNGNLAPGFQSKNVHMIESTSVKTAIVSRKICISREICSTHKSVPNKNCPVMPHKTRERRQARRKTANPLKFSTHMKAYVNKTLRNVQ